MLSAAFSSDVMTVLKRESVAMLVEHAAAFKSRDSLSDGLEIIKEAAVGCLRIVTCVKQRTILQSMQLVVVAARCALESEDGAFTWPDASPPPEGFFVCQKPCPDDASMMSRCRDEFGGHDVRLAETRKHVEAALLELEDSVFFQADNIEISMLAKQAALVFEDCKCFLTGFQSLGLRADCQASC